MVLPSSMVAAVASSAAAGKNPWLPLALIFLLAAPSSVPGVMMDPALHGQLHSLGPVELLWTLGAVFAVLAVLDSIADKVGFLEKWLVPVSTSWRPFAGVACAALIGVAAARELPEATQLEALHLALTETRHADSLWLGGSMVALTIAVALVFNWISTMSKTGVRLLLTMVPIPGLKLAHSFVDDFFAFGATVAGFAFADTLLVPALLALYLLLGVFTGPLLTRLTWIHVRIGWSLLRKMFKDDAAPPAPPKWARRWLEAEGLGGATALPAYVYRAPELGWCRAGHLVIADGRALFLSRVWWRPTAWVVPSDALARIGYADTATTRVVTVVERLPSGALREAHVQLFPAIEDEVIPVLDRATSALVRVRLDSQSARAALPGFADRTRSVRFLPQERAGSLRLQGLLTIAAAIAGGVLTAGVFVPIGAGYLASPFKRRFLLGLLVSGYLGLCVVGSVGLGWPFAVLYASVLNAVALRDLTSNALKARLDGFVDRRAWLPVVADRVWVPPAGLDAEADRWSSAQEAETTDGTWRVVTRLLADPLPAG